MTSDLVYPSDLGCSNWNWNSQICLSCSKNWVLISNKCIPVSDQCLTWDQNSGDCLTCYTGYNLSSGKCLIQDLTLINPPDKGCSDYSLKGQFCLKCSIRWYLNSDGVCTPVNDLCKTNDVNGRCLTCYDGYLLNDGTCVLSDVVKPSDLGCGKWDWNNQVCISCSNGFTFNANKVCVPVSDQCKSYDVNGSCTACFKGYDLANGVCSFSSSNNAKPVDLGCASWNWDTQVCRACSKNWVFNSNNVCVPVSDQCNTFDAAGLCTSCFKGYDVVNGSCTFSPSNTAKPSDLGCGKWDWDNQLCLTCSSGYVFNKNNVCVPVSDQCKTSNDKGECTSCYKGYDLVNGVCRFSDSNNDKPSDEGCSKWDWDNQVCLQCSKGYSAQALISGKRICVLVTDLCKTYSDDSSSCTSCFKGYDLVDGSCILSAFNNAKPSDLGCGKWDWDNQVCLSCSKGFVFNAKKICTPVSDQCASFDT